MSISISIQTLIYSYIYMCIYEYTKTSIYIHVYIGLHRNVSMGARMKQSSIRQTLASFGVMRITY